MDAEEENGVAEEELGGLSRRENLRGRADRGP